MDRHLCDQFVVLIQLKTTFSSKHRAHHILSSDIYEYINIRWRDAHDARYPSEIAIRADVRIHQRMYAICFPRAIVVGVPSWWLCVH